MKQEQIISNEYMTQMENVQKWRNEWTEKCSQEKYYELINDVQQDVPVLSQLKLVIPSNEYKVIMKDFISFMVGNTEMLKEDLDKLSNFTEELNVDEWIQKLIEFDEAFFVEIGNELEIASWLPQYVGEQAIRPILKVMSSQMKNYYEESKVSHVCKFCGEPVRLAKSGENGKKIVVCPRCEAQWENKKITCSICGDENHENLTILKIEDDTKALIQACKACGGYIKLIESQIDIEDETAEMLDLKTIHFDYIAQEYLEKNESKTVKH